MADLNLGLPHPILLTSECSSYTDKNYYHYGNSDQYRNQKQQKYKNQKQRRNQKQKGRSRYLGSGSGVCCFHDQSSTLVPFYLRSSWSGGVR